ncbi:MAG: hypothetical protein ABW189_05830 [Rickettsiales bacterium]
MDRRVFFVAATLILSPAVGLAEAPTASVGAHHVAEVAQAVHAAGAEEQRQMRDLLQRREALLVAEKFDADAYIKLSDAIEKASAAKYDAKNKTLVNAAKTMTQQERSRLSLALRRRFSSKENE